MTMWAESAPELLMQNQTVLTDYSASVAHSRADTLPDLIAYAIEGRSMHAFQSICLLEEGMV